MDVLSDVTLTCHSHMKGSRTPRLSLIGPGRAAALVCQWYKMSLALRFPGLCFHITSRCVRRGGWGLFVALRKERLLFRRQQRVKRLFLF